ncbi:MAG: NAD(P)/FAD-dependent oxidoreductase [Proteobacteria bacterium]|nr:NAD(P)/FAD-dependent oxidoreductase [Pseudomonadota bacterium]
MERESMEYDVVIVGAGPSGLACAIRLKLLAEEQGREVAVCVLEKGAEVGAHILSGAVIEPRALDELLPDWADRGAPLNTPAVDDCFLFLTETGAYRLPTPPQMNNHGNYIISLGNLARWLAEQAEALGVEIYPGFAAAEVLYDDEGRVRGVATGDMGIGRDGQAKPSHEPGIELLARYTLFAEGSRGSLTKQLFERFDLRSGVDPQTYGIGIKELWEVSPDRHQPGRGGREMPVAAGPVGRGDGVNAERRAALERAGWRVADAADFLGLSEQERELIDPGAGTEVLTEMSDIQRFRHLGGYRAHIGVEPYRKAGNVRHPGTLAAHIRPHRRLGGHRRGDE